MNEPLVHGDDDKEGEAALIKSHRRRLWWIQLLTLFLAVGSCIGQFVMPFVSCSFRFDTQIMALLRLGPAVNGIPPLVLLPVGPFDAAYALAVANGALAVGSLFSFFFTAEEVGYVQRGVYPFAWTTLAFSNLPLILAINLISGIVVWTEDLALLALAGGWLCVLWLGTWINSLGHIDANKNREFSWAFLLMATLLYAAFNTVLYVEVGTQYQQGGAAILLVPPIAFTVLYSLLIIPLLCHYLIRGLGSELRALRWIYILNALCVLVVSWASIVIFAYDGITPPHC